MLLAALGAALGMLIVLAQPAAAAGVSNPGNFGATVLAGSSLTLSGGTVFGIGVPACSDGVDNDLAGGTDFPADTSCTAANDANERLAGLQAYVQPKVNTAVSGTGVINLAIAGYVFPPGEICVAAIGTWCLNATIAGDGATVGSINPEGPTAAAADGTISLPIDLRVELDAVVGFPGLSANCRILPATATLASTNYNKTNGNATLTNGAAVAVPAVAGCGSFLGLSYDTLINGQLGLPGTANASLLVQIRNAANQPVLP